MKLTRFNAGLALILTALSASNAGACPNLTGDYKADGREGTLTLAQVGCESLTATLSYENQIATFITDGRVRKIDADHPALFGGTALSIWFTETSLQSNNLELTTPTPGAPTEIISLHSTIERDGPNGLKLTSEKLDPVGQSQGEPIQIRFRRLVSLKRASQATKF